MNDLISIIVPVYNGEKYIVRCIESLLNQTYKNIEILIINDNSSDDTMNLISMYNENKKIKIFSNKKNHGVSYSRNKALKHANGNYVMFVDVDDYLVNDSIEYMYFKAVETECDVICGNASDRIKMKYDSNKEVYIKQDEVKVLIEKMLLNNNYKCSVNIMGYAWGKLYKKRIIENCFFYEDIRFKEDTLFNIKVYKNAKKIGFLSKVCYIYQTNENSASFKYFDNYLEEVKLFINIMEDIINGFVLDSQAIYICGMFMYMNYLKHYVMHKDLKEIEPINLIKETFEDEFWRKIFLNVNFDRLSLAYKLLYICYKLKYGQGIIMLYKINERRKRK